MVPPDGLGTLYSKYDLSNTFFEVKLIKSLVPFAGDLWMKVQTLLVNKSIVTNDQLVNLVKINVKSGGGMMNS